MALEMKFCPIKKREKEIIAEINDDIAAYKPGCTAISAVVVPPTGPSFANILLTN